MSVLLEPARVERRVFTSRHVAVGEWRLAREHPQFADTGPTRQCLVAFPRTAVAIAHEGRPEFIADPGVATVYNRGQAYRRRAVDPAGDRCDWFGIDDRWATDIALANGMDVRDPGAPFRVDRAPVGAALYLAQRELLQRLATGAADELEAEEGVIALVHAVCASALRAGGPGVRRAARTTRHRDLAHDALSLVAQGLREPLRLDLLAGRLGVSVFHLCRVFRAEFGLPLHRHLARMRLRAALEPVAEPGSDLTAVALAHGFASHSHFTAAFKREYGCTPSAWRTRLHRAAAASPQPPAAGLPRRR
jgi:AraC-like DNA-binding protein